MITCPKCGRPVSGRARSCGYCGGSLVQDYFTGGGAKAEPERPATAAGIAGTALGICGAVALLVALGFHMAALFGFCDPQLAPRFTFPWALRTLLMTVLPVVLLVQQAVLRGRHSSLTMDCVWIFCAACALMVVVQSYLDSQAQAFYGVAMIPYLLVVGCALALFGAVAGAIGCRSED